MRVRDLARRVLSTQFVRFCIIGGIGFVTDAVVLLGLIYWFHLSPLGARFLSFACAVLVTFELNRRLTFREGSRSYLFKLVTYVAVQSLGFTCNFLVYAGLYLWLEPLSASPIIALAAASVAALFVNYLGAKIVVFGRAASVEEMADL